jgi:hypothetical protein
MKRSLFLKSLPFVSVALFLAFTSMAQGGPRRTSPAATATGKIGAANVTIAYSSPAVDDRKVWGELVPYDKAWRAGANQATTLETDKELTIGGKKLPPGKYSLFATPSQDKWTITLNSQTGQWGIKAGGVANFDPEKNVLTVDVTPRKSATMNERLAYVVNGDGVVLQWENLEVPISIK